MALRILKDVGFHNWALDAGLSDKALLTAAREVEAGLIDARLSGFLFKKRVATEGRGKRGSFRTIIGYQHATRFVFLHGFAKNESENITRREHDALKRLCDTYMSADDHSLKAMIKAERLLEIIENEPDT